jgi:hypothetical protein
MYAAQRLDGLLPGFEKSEMQTCKCQMPATLLFTPCRGYGQAIDCVSYVTGTEWVSGSSDGGLALWSQLKKKPVRNDDLMRHRHQACRRPQGPRRHILSTMHDLGCTARAPLAVDSFARWSCGPHVPR